jgi:hypothetical protein
MKDAAKILSIVIALHLVSNLGWSQSPHTKKEVEQGTEPISELRYAASEAPLVYKLTLAVDFGDKRQNIEQTRVLAYTVKADDNDSLRTSCESSTLPGKRSYGPSFSDRQSIFDLGPLGLPTFRMTPSSTISPAGKIVDVPMGNWLCGLPIDLGRLVFPELSDQQEWKIEQPVALGYNARYSRNLQIIPVSPKIKRPPNARTYGSPRQPASPELVTLATTQRKRAGGTGALVRIEESLEIDADKFDPKVKVVGRGAILFSPEKNSIDSMTRTFVVTMTKPNQSITVPITLSLLRLTGTELADYQQAKKEAAERLAQAQEKREAMEDALPTMDNRLAVIAMFREGPDDRVDALGRKLWSDEIQDDRELAWEVYESLFRVRNVPYHMQELIKRLDPELEKTASILGKYSSSFDVSLTGDKVSTDQELVKRQVICYPDYSRWKAAYFYGSVDDVLVLTTRERDPKLIAIKRDTCRLPITAFEDPTLKSKD